LQIRHSSHFESSERAMARVLVETLRLTRSKQEVDLETIRHHAEITTATAKAVLRPYLGSLESQTILIDPRIRFAIAQKAAQLGALEQVAKALTWQEFEAFGEECLKSVGFKTWKGLILKDEKRRWQIDLAGRKGSMVLSIDCKHWNSPSFPSKLKGAAAHQRLALPPLMRRVESDLDADGPLWALPVVLTLLDPRSRILDQAVLVSVGQFSDFLEHVTPYDYELPFISKDHLGKAL
jgi:hypothetical protein